MNVASKSTNASPAVCGSRDSIASLSAAHGESADAVLGIALASHGNLALVRAALRASSVRTPDLADDPGKVLRELVARLRGIRRHARRRVGCDELPHGCC
jgi:hypothetical protein